MRSRQLDTALTALVGAAGAHLRSELASGAEVPFALDSHAGRRDGARTTLYCYRALTREFIAERDANIGRLPGYEEAAGLLDEFTGLDRYLVRAGEDVAAIEGRARARAAITVLLADVFDQQSDFKVRAERLHGALGRLHDSALAHEDDVALVATLHGMTITSGELELTRGLTIARHDAIAGLPEAAAARGPGRDRDEHLVVVHRVTDDDLGSATRRGRAVLRDLLTALRLFGDGRIALGAVGWVQAGGGPWSPFALGGSGRVQGMLVVPADQEDELRAFCNLVSRRAPHGNELAWALERFELGCEREDPLTGLSDHLLALRAVLEPEGYWSGMLPGRLAALCAAPPQRLALSERVAAAVALERATIDGTATLDAPSRELALEIAAHLKALLRDVICGHLASDLAGFADELLAREEDGDSTPDGAAGEVDAGGLDDDEDPADEALEPDQLVGAGHAAAPTVR